MIITPHRKVLRSWKLVPLEMTPPLPSPPGPSGTGRAGGVSRQRRGGNGSEAGEDTDEGEMESREVDYMSDSDSDAEVEIKVGRGGCEGVRWWRVCVCVQGIFLVGGKGGLDCCLSPLQIGSNKIIQPQDPPTTGSHANIPPLQNIPRKYPALTSPKLAKNISGKSPV